VASEQEALMFDITPSLDCGGRVLAFDRARVVGILNVTPDSFSRDGLSDSPDAAIKQGMRMIEEGADALDVGGESTRPGADEVSVEEELLRVIPVIERLVKECAVPIWIDTSKPEVMRAAVGAGAGLINDVQALRRDGAMDAAASLKVPVVLMHMQGDPCTMQDAPYYDDVVSEVHRFLAERIFACEMSGIPKKKIVVDPGFGFGKTLDHNLALLRQLARFTDLGVPVLAGLSRKGMIGTLTDRVQGERVHGSVAAALIAARYGAKLLRVHDVAATVDAMKVWNAVAAQTVPKWGDED
jgi:dihydropteroate synthase